MISESVLLVQGGMTSLETRLESESSQDMSQDSRFASKEETWTPKVRTGLSRKELKGGRYTARGRRPHFDSSMGRYSVNFASK